MPRTRADEWLVLRAQSGDRRALAELLGHTQRRLHPHAVAMLGDADDADDVMQEVLITIARKLHVLQESRAYDAWTRRIASRAIMAAIRRSRRHERAHVPIDASHEEPAIEAPDADPLLVAALPAMLQQVSPASREVLALHYMDDLPLGEIAAVLGLAVGTVKSRLSYGLRQLRQLVPSP